MRSRNFNFITFVNYIFIFLVVNYSLFVNFITGVDSAGYGLSLLSIIVVFLNFRDFNQIQSQRPVLFWLLLCIYAFLNYYIHPHNIQIPLLVLYRRVFVPLVSLLVVIKEYKNDKYRLLWLCFITYATFFALGAYFDKGLISGVEGTHRQLGNHYAITSCLSVFFLILLNRNKKISLPLTVVIIILVMIVVSMTGTRKAFGAGLIIISFWIYSFSQKRELGSWLIIGFFIVVGYFGYQYLLDNTYMGARMEYLEEQQVESLPGGAPEFLSIFGDRASHYYYGWLSFLNHPLFGVGTGQSSVAGGSYIHTEYIAQLSDGGILGFSLFFFFLYRVIKNVFKHWHNDSVTCRCMCGGLAALLFLYFTTWGWEFPDYFICWGTLVAYGWDFTYNDISKS